MSRDFDVKVKFTAVEVALAPGKAASTSSKSPVGASAPGSTTVVRVSTTGSPVSTTGGVSTLTLPPLSGTMSRAFVSGTSTASTSATSSTHASTRSTVLCKFGGKITSATPSPRSVGTTVRIRTVTCENAGDCTWIRYSATEWTSNSETTTDNDIMMAEWSSEEHDS